MPCSIERMPARTAFLMPSAPWAWAITQMPGRGRLLDERLELDRPEVGVARVVARREHAAAGRDLDHVGAHPDELADLAPDLVRTVDDARRPAGCAIMNGTWAPDGYQSSPWPPVWLSIDERDLHPRPGDQALARPPP